MIEPLFVFVIPATCKPGLKQAFLCKLYLQMKEFLLCLLSWVLIVFFLNPLHLAWVYFYVCMIVHPSSNIWWSNPLCPLMDGIATLSTHNIALNFLLAFRITTPLIFYSKRCFNNQSTAWFSYLDTSLKKMFIDSITCLITIHHFLKFHGTLHLLFSQFITIWDSNCT